VLRSRALYKSLPPGKARSGAAPPARQISSCPAGGDDLDDCDVPL